MGEGARLGRAEPGARVFARLVLRGMDAFCGGRSTAGVLGGTRSTGAVGTVVLIEGTGGYVCFISK